MQDKPHDDATDPNQPGTPKPGNGERERDLIAEALRQASPRGSASVASGMDLPDQSFPGYDVLREIHRGGQGVVYQALQRTTKRKVAIKLLHGGPFTGSAGRSRFEREVQVLGQLNHPNIVRIHDSGRTADGSFFYVMDYISGRSLDEVIADKRPDIPECLRLFGKICDAVNAAHLKGVIHRDLKPANVRVDPGGEPIVVDFGLAKIATPDVMDAEPGDATPRLMTMTGQFIGSLPWASPEQAEGLPSNIDVRTDVYSLGVILYQMLTGKFPYTVIGNMREVLDNILRAEPARPSTIRRQINDEVETIVLKCLAKDRERRYQSAGELARDIKRYLAGEPIEAKRDSGMYLVGKALRRHKFAVGTAVAITLLVAVFAVVMAVMYRTTLESERKTKLSLNESVAARKAEAAERDRANENFRAGHSLAMTMLTDIADEISDLRGSTRARETLLGEAKKYLDRLKAEAGDDPQLLLDLAKAHERVGDLRGVIYMRRLGDTNVADAHFAEAARLREALYARLPADPRTHIALARTRYRAAGSLQLRRDFASAVEKFREALMLYDSGLALATGQEWDSQIPKWRGDRAWSVRALGNALLRMSQSAAESGDTATSIQLTDQAKTYFAEAERHWASVVQTDPANTDAARGLLVIADHRAALLGISAKSLADSAAASHKAGKLEEAKTLWEASLKKLEESRNASLAAADEFRRLSQVENASQELRRDLWISMRSAGQTWMQTATTLQAMAALPDRPPNQQDMLRAQQSGLRLLEEATAVARRLGDEDAASLEARRDVAACLGSLGAMQVVLKLDDAASATYAETVAIREAVLSADPIERHRMDLASALAAAGGLKFERAKAAPQPAQKEQAAEAVRLLERAMNEYQQLIKLNVLDKASGAVKETQKKLDEASAILGGSGGR